MESKVLEDILAPLHRPPRRRERCREFLSVAAIILTVFTGSPEGVISKQPFWIPGPGLCIEPRLHFGVGTMPIGCLTRGHQCAGLCHVCHVNGSRILCTWQCRPGCIDA